MVPEYCTATLAPMPITTGAIATSWGCAKCGHTNVAMARRMFRIPRFICSCCHFKGYGYFSFSFACLRINGLKVMPPVRNQHIHPVCTAVATLNAMGIILRICAATQNITITRTLCWRDVIRKYEKALKCEFNGHTQVDKAWGRMKGMLDVVKNMGVVDNGGALYKIEDWRWFHYMGYEEAVEILASGRPLLAVVRYLPHFITLGEHDIYSTRGCQGPENELHVIVLIGASADYGAKVFQFLDSHGTHCQVGGIGNVYAEECYMGYGYIEWNP